MSCSNWLNYTVQQISQMNLMWHGSWLKLVASYSSLSIMHTRGNRSCSVVKAGFFLWILADGFYLQRKCDQTNSCFTIFYGRSSQPAAGTRGFPSNSSLTSLALPHWASLAPWKEVSTGFQKLKKGTAVNNRIFTDSSTIKWPISLAFYKQKEALLTKQEHSFNKKDPQSICWKPWKALFWNK